MAIEYKDISWDEARENHRKKMAEAEEQGYDFYLKGHKLGDPIERINEEDMKEAEFLMDVREMPSPDFEFTSSNGYEDVSPFYRKFAGKHTGINAQKMAYFLLYLSSYNEFGGQDEIFNLIVELDKQNGRWALTRRLADYFTEDLKNAPECECGECSDDDCECEYHRD